MSRNVPKLRFNGFDGELKSFKFKQLVKLQRGSSPRPIVKYITDSDDGVNWIKIGDVSKGETIINSTKEKITKEGALKSRFVQVGDLILSNSMSYGRPYIMGIDGYIHDGWFVLRDYENNFKRDYLCQLLTSSVIQKQYKKLAAGGVVDNISSELVNSVSIKLPSLQEQEKIVNFLSKVDSIIEKQEKKVQYWNSYKKGMMQKIFSQKIRFKDENGMDYPEWEKKNLKYVLSEISEKTKENNQYEVLSSTANGVFKQSEYFNREIASADNTGYKILRLNQIVLSPQNLWLGNINYNNKYDMGIVSPSYKIFNINKNLNEKYISYIIKTDRMLYGYKQASEQGASVVRRNLNMDLFYDILINIPCVEEQEKIANFLSNIDNIIEKESKKLEELKQWKKGLLQQMFV
ncbi:restriction endonuclease subunit S [Clostridium perfringens]|uniref:restriction endonuclease subunit S n=1 Tax=Clostridium perfringens TaxID=1502 RepID=UPI000E15DA25|nr:restriction endonuclease subunit S [Clostridium perfringens]MBP2860870.1 restriction endonuclease subunit S [Clostridium perfringens]MDM0457655.1 restriction endonuclease subunit S [Clostridium perfringens]STB55488.1 type I restriction enzyme, specificity subunit [Clostridium perfringens]SUY36610.1 type I restriction enzyme, specificity subunit [Clostridium perfringens]HAT4186655.1 restriction endonuclease subunit S [Clostridium perfringens]